MEAFIYVVLLVWTIGRGFQRYGIAPVPPLPQTHLDFWITFFLVVSFKLCLLVVV